MILWNLCKKRFISWLWLLFLTELWIFCTMYAASSSEPCYSIIFPNRVCDSGDRWEWGCGNKTITLVSRESCLAVNFFSQAVEEKQNTWEVRDPVSAYAVTFEYCEIIFIWKKIIPNLSQIILIHPNWCVILDCSWSLKRERLLKNLV